jgi:ribonuclease P/MRP protein subunit RPP40
LGEITEEKDLGVWISSDLKPSLQCTRAANKAMVVLRSIKKSFRYIDRRCFLILYKCFVRPHLEYCVQAWSPYFRKDIDKLEKVQRRPTKLVHSTRHLNYESRLKSLGLYSLEQRRVRGDLIETYKLLTDKENIESRQFFKMASGTTRGNTKKLYKERSRELSTSGTRCHQAL